MVVVVVCVEVVVRGHCVSQPSQNHTLQAASQPPRKDEQTSNTQCSVVVVVVVDVYGHSWQALQNQFMQAMLQPPTTVAHINASHVPVDVVVVLLRVDIELNVMLVLVRSAVVLVVATPIVVEAGLVGDIVPAKVVVLVVVAVVPAVVPSPFVVVLVLELLSTGVVPEIDDVVVSATRPVAVVVSLAVPLVLLDIDAPSETLVAVLLEVKLAPLLVVVCARHSTHAIQNH
jgi:hypothetical protein